MDILTDKKMYSSLPSGLTPSEGMVKAAPLYGKKSEKGVALVIVLILSAVALAFMTALIYMILSGTQISGLQKRYKTALEAGKGGYVLFSKFVGRRGQSVDTTTFLNSLTPVGITSSAPIMTSSCSGATLDGITYNGLQAKLMTSSSSWSNACSKSVSIDPNDPTTYDLKLTLGSPKYDAYYKIVGAVEGNTGPSSGGGGIGDLASQGVVASSSEIPVPRQPYLYAVEVMASNSTTTTNERAKLSVLYEY